MTLPTLLMTTKNINSSWWYWYSYDLCYRLWYSKLFVNTNSWKQNGVYTWRWVYIMECIVNQMPWNISTKLPSVFQVFLFMLAMISRMIAFFFQMSSILSTDLLAPCTFHLLWVPCPVFMLAHHLIVQSSLSCHQHEEKWYFMSVLTSLTKQWMVNSSTNHGWRATLNVPSTNHSLVYSKSWSINIVANSKCRWPSAVHSPL